jgi:DNA-binding CsgD family transcriptional regulator
VLLALLVDAGRLDEAMVLFDQLAADDFGAFPKDNEWLFAISLLSETAVVLDDRASAARLYAQLSPYAGLVALAASEVTIGPVDRPLGMLAAAVGRVDDAVRHFEAAIAACRRTGARPWLAHSQYHYAVMLARQTRVEDWSYALELATSARVIADQLEMIRLVALAEELLAKLQPMQAAASTEQGPLTRREREVAHLIATGMSNRQIAEQLFVSERTVETHVQHIFTKLSFTSRSQVAAWVVREDLGGAR